LLLVDLVFVEAAFWRVEKHSFHIVSRVLFIGKRRFGSERLHVGILAFVFVFVEVCPFGVQQETERERDGCPPETVQREARKRKSLLVFPDAGARGKTSPSRASLWSTSSGIRSDQMEDHASGGH